MTILLVTWHLRITHHTSGKMGLGDVGWWGYWVDRWSRVFRHFPTPSEGVKRRSPSPRAPESHFNEFTSGCTRFFNRLKISNLQIILHIWPISKEGGCAVHFAIAWFTKMFFSPVHHEVNSLRLHSSRPLRSAFWAWLEDCRWSFCKMFGAVN